ncbi:MAG: FAD:protein FMN transferase, partial [Bacteroidota bacterium]
MTPLKANQRRDAGLTGISVRLLILFTLLVTNAVYGRAASAQTLDRYEYREIRMGMQVRLALYAPNEQTALRAAGGAFDRIDELENIFSTYRPASEISRLNQRAGDLPVRLSSELFSVLDRGMDLAQRTGGAFDVTVGPLIDLWLESRKSELLPDPDVLAATRERVGWQHLVLDASRR